MLVLMRHGQASFGSVHYDRLSVLGMEQAAATGVFLREREESCTEMCVGTRERHLETAKALTQAWQVSAPYRHERDLDEFADSTGILSALRQVGYVDVEQEEGSRLQRLFSRIAEWANGDLVIPGSPTLPQFRERIGLWIRHELATGSAETHTMVVTSGGVIAAAMCEVLKLPNSAFAALAGQVRNASLTEFRVSRGQPVIVNFNGTSHLPRHLITSI